MKFRRRKPSELFDGAELPAPQDLARLMREKPEQASQKVLAHLQFLDREHEKLQKNIKRLNSQHRLAVLVTLAILAIIISISFLVTLNKSEAIIFTLVIGALTGIFPASYIAYLFYRSRVQRERLKDDLRLLGLVTDEKISEINELYQTVYSPLQFVVYIILLTALSTLIFGAYYAVSTDSRAFSFIEAAVVKITFYGFLGAYFFGIQLVVRRYNTFDLQPQVYSSIILRTLLAVVVTFSAASIIENFSEFSSLSADSAAEGGPVAEAGEADGRVDEVQLVPWQVLAFIIGIFPSRGVRWLNFIVSRALSDPLDRYNERSLRKIIGINTWHEARLAELGIDNVQSLATADMCKLLLTTQFDTQQIINWIDQAILHMKVGSKVDRFTENQIITFHELQTALTRLPNPAPSRQLNGAAENSPREDAQANHRERLAASLGVMTADEVQRLSDYSNYPNYAYIQEFYAAIADIASEQASSGKQSILSTLGSQYSIGGSLLTNVHDLLGDNDVALESAEDVEAIEAEIEKLRTYLDLNPKKPQLFVEIGIRYYLTGQKDKALQAYNYAIELDGRLAEAYSNRSFIHIDQENYELAIFDTTKA
ncbi:MAG: hypothetical protein F6K04_05645, partial [Leptolyngbya sp. SIO4C5]|nr:hypothetical protein [Leptolyngbya sp. SIO4C5]